MIVHIASAFIYGKHQRKTFRAARKGWANIRCSPDVMLDARRFITLNSYPIASEDCAYRFVENNEDCDTAVVLQGPLMEDFDFTVETVSLYRTTMRFAKIIVSTWEDASKDAVERLRKLGAEVLRSPLLKKDSQEEFGNNINKQIATTRAGIELAKKLGCAYVLKSRTDQRIYETDVIGYCKRMQRAFPLRERSDAQCKRIVVPSLNTFKYRLYDVTDMFMFGATDDILRYWQCPWCNRSPVELSKDASMIEWSKTLNACEIYCMSNWLERTGWKLQWTLQDSWKAYAKCFCVVDTRSIGLFWPKYTMEDDRWRNFEGRNLSMEALTFKEWLKLYLNNGACPEGEEKYARSASYRPEPYPMYMT